MNYPQPLERIGAVSEWSGSAVHERMAADGYSRNIDRSDPVRRRRVAEAARLLADAMEGRVDPFLFKQAMNPTSEIYVHHLAEHYPGIFGTASRKLREGTISVRETMSYTDYSALTVDILDRMLYRYYTAAPITTMPLVKKHTLRDFRLVARYEMDGAVKPFSRMPFDFPALNPHGAGEPPTERAMTQEPRITYQPQLYQGMVSVNWRAIVNDDLGIFQDLIQRLSISGNRTISEFITLLYVSAGGWNTTLANGANFQNLVTTAYGSTTNNPALSFQGLLDGLTVLAKQVDSDGQPIVFDGTIYLLHGPALKTTAQSMAKAIQADISVGGGTTNTQGFPSQRLRIDNWPMQGVVPIEDKYIPLVCTTSGTKDTMWALVYDPSIQPRPTVELGMLAGFETPQIFQEVPNTMRVGGGVAPELGNFYTMNQNYKGVLVLGGHQIDGRSAVFSTGQGV